MKSNNGLQIIIRITVCVTMLSSLIGAFMLHSTPSHRESGSVLILVSVAAAVLLRNLFTYSAALIAPP